jgi:hypothetical protein
MGIHEGSRVKSHINIWTSTQMGLTKSPICKRLLENDGSATHILRDCGATGYLRFRHLAITLWSHVTTKTPL